MGSPGPSDPRSRRRVKVWDGGQGSVPQGRDRRPDGAGSGTGGGTPLRPRHPLCPCGTRVPSRVPPSRPLPIHSGGEGGPGVVVGPDSVAEVLRERLETRGRQRTHDERHPRTSGSLRVDVSGPTLSTHTPCTGPEAPRTTTGTKTATERRTDPGTDGFHSRRVREVPVSRSREGRGTRVSGVRLGVVSGVLRPPHDSPEVTDS